MLLVPGLQKILTPKATHQQPQPSSKYIRLSCGDVMLQGDRLLAVSVDVLS